MIQKQTFIMFMYCQTDVSCVIYVKKNKNIVYLGRSQIEELA